MQIISSSEINALYPLVRLGNDFLFSNIQTISSSQISTLHFFPQKFTLYPLPGKRTILFSDIHIISSSQKCTLYPLPGKKTLYHFHRNTHYFLFTEIHTIYSSQKNTLYPLKRNPHYILLS